MLESARLKLTAWYLVIIMTISIVFSFIIYSSVTSEFRHFEKFQVKLPENTQNRAFIAHPPQDHFIQFIGPDPEVIENAKKRVLFVLVFINLTILGVSGAAGYFLAGRTLRPIKQMVDEQKRFITDASHELRTPITSLRSEIEVALRNKKLSLVDTQKLLKSNLEEVISLHTLSDNLLELAQNGRLIDPKHLQRVSLQEVIDKASKKVEPLAKSKQIVITNAVKKYTVQGIPDRLIEVFVILLDNAIKYSKKNNVVIVSAKREKNKIAVLVEDHGIGIAEEDLPHIFDRFYRASKSRSKTKISGYGLGLSIAKKILEAQGGTITAKSDKNGTVFVLVFPA